LDDGSCPSLAPVVPVPCRCCCCCCRAPVGRGRAAESEFKPFDSGLSSNLGLPSPTHFAFSLLQPLLTRWTVPLDPTAAPRSRLGRSTFSSARCTAQTVAPASRWVHPRRPRGSASLLAELTRAFISTGPISLVASFSGPMEVRIRDERLDRATLEVHHRPLDGTAGAHSSLSRGLPCVYRADNPQSFVSSYPGITSKALESTLETSLLQLLQLTSHPRSLVLLTIQALSAPPLPVLPKPVDRFNPSPEASSSTSSLLNRKWPVVPTSEKALALTSASLAAMDASSVGMTGLALGSCCALLPGGQWVLDPNYDEERAATAIFGVGWAFGAALGVEKGDGAGREVVWLESDGDFDEDDVRSVSIFLSA